jgi:tetratricopeptide (TPR) repeat protein
MGIRNKSMRVFTIILLILLYVNLPYQSIAYAKSYTYNVWDKEIPAPEAYEWERSIRAEDLGVSSINNMTDIYYRNNKFYLVGDGQLIITDENFKTLEIITNYIRDGKEVAIKAPKGVFATEEGDIYITEQDMGEIIHLDADGNFARALGNPGITGLEKVTFAPTKVVVGDAGRIYVKAKSIYEGIIELNPEGKYLRFVGANKVNPSPLDIFYRAVATEKQVSRMKLWLPTDFVDIAIDKDGFLMAVTTDNKSRRPVRKLNSKGEDVLASYEYIESPKGDYIHGMALSNLTAISTAEDGRFAILDSNMARIFVYSEDGLLAYTIGGSGKRQGELSSPIDITFCGEKIIVADLIAATMEVYAPTEYGSLINQALRYQGRYEYENASQYWKKAYELNPNSILINMGLGKYQLRAGDYEGVMNSFIATGERQSYSVAFEIIREKFLEKHLGKVLLALIIFIIFMKILSGMIKHHSKQGDFEHNKFMKQLRRLKENFVTWPGYVLSNPFKAFDAVKYERAGSTITCVVISILFSWSMLLRQQYSGFLTNFGNPEEINVPLVLISSVFPYLVFVVSNWAVGVLIDGKGTLENIFKVNMYALYPSVFLYITGTLISSFVIYEETTIVWFMYGLAAVIYLFYTFVGLVMVHQFSFTKGIVSVLLSIAAMFIIMFVIVLLVTIVSGFINDVGTIIDEIILYL